MASTTSLSVSLAIFLVVIFASRSHATSRHLSSKESVGVGVGIRVTLKHVDSGKNMTKFERIQHGMKRAHHRLQKLRAMVLASGDSELTAPIHAGSGEFLLQLSIGLVGLGRGPLSLVSQLKESKFSYCLTSIDDNDNKTSTLFMGPLANLKKTDGFKTTPLVQNPSQPTFYYLSLEGISIGDTRLPIEKSTFALQDDGSGGLIIDSGTTITYLEESAFREIQKELTSQVDLPLDYSGAAGLDLCFTLPSDSTKLKLPKFVFHFEKADLELPRDNYMIVDSSSGLACLAMSSSNGMSILGNVQQQNMLVVHDLKKGTMSFLHTKCDDL
ncbi:hypothetical protein ACFE04_017004 [Oxalis oulophora]